jgi:hypothetical protein
VDALSDMDAIAADLPLGLVAGRNDDRGSVGDRAALGSDARLDPIAVERLRPLVDAKRMGRVDEGNAEPALSGARQIRGIGEMGVNDIGPLRKLRDMVAKGLNQVRKFRVECLFLQIRSIRGSEAMNYYPRHDRFVTASMRISEFGVLEKARDDDDLIDVWQRDLMHRRFQNVRDMTAGVARHTKRNRRRFQTAA